jgi:hypothetical protein
VDLLGFEEQSLRVHQQVALPAAHLLAAVVAPLLVADAGGLCRVGVCYPGARKAVPARAARTRSRSVALSRSKVPSKRHLLNHQ